MGACLGNRRDRARALDSLQMMQFGSEFFRAMDGKGYLAHIIRGQRHAIETPERAADARRGG